jgi:FHA domain
MFKMTINKIMAIILSITAIVIIASLLFFSFNNIFQGIEKMSVDFILAIIMAAIAGLIIEQLYKKYSPQSKILKTTITHNPHNNISFAKLILPNNNNIIVNGIKRTIGREDFVGVVSTDKLLFIGKDHFRITKEPDGFYIEDLKTKNGTQVNGQEVTHKKLLNTDDEIFIGKTLKIKYIEKKTID